jgi:hypothetical protein
LTLQSKIKGSTIIIIAQQCAVADDCWLFHDANFSVHCQGFYALLGHHGGCNQGAPKTGKIGCLKVVAMFCVLTTSLCGPAVVL